MPAKNSVKLYIENGYYHLYNRGVEKRNIFLDEQDYAVFLHYLKKYLDPILGSDPKWKYKSLASEVEILAFCLMPNHFHLLVKQSTKKGIIKLMRVISTCYAMYFNEKYGREGTLFQGKYKGVLIENDSYLLHLTRYIHLNPGSDPKTYIYSSYKYYLNERRNTWINTKEVLSFFRSRQRIGTKDYFSYQSFVDDFPIGSEEILEELILEDSGSDPKLNERQLWNVL